MVNRMPQNNHKICNLDEFSLAHLILFTKLFLFHHFHFPLLTKVQIINFHADLCTIFMHISAQEELHDIQQQLHSSARNEETRLQCRKSIFLRWNETRRILAEWPCTGGYAHAPKSSSGHSSSQGVQVTRTVQLSFG